MTAPTARVVQWRPRRGPPRRIEFEPVPDGYLRVERVWTGCRWRATGRERVRDATFDAPDHTADAGP